MLRDFAALRAAQGNATGAAALRKMAAAISKDTMDKMCKKTRGLSPSSCSLQVEF